MAVVLLPGLWRRVTLAVAWGFAVVGIALRLVPLHMSRSLSTALYIGMGWCALFCFFKLARLVSVRSLVPAVLGGLFYCVGAVLNWIHWPTFWPGAFSTHDFYHLFVMAGSLYHFWFMLTVVAPYERPVGLGFAGTTQSPVAEP